MEKIPINNIYIALADAIPDPAVGISLAYLVGDEDFSVYASKIQPHCHLNAHFHYQGGEMYQVVEGKGNVWLGDIGDGRSYRQKSYIEVIRGDTFMVPEKTVHQLVNPADEPLIMIFGCPQAHITTDRELVDALVEDNKGDD